MPAIANTTARTRRIAGLVNLRLPYSAPTHPPTTAATPQTGSAAGSTGSFIMTPDSPAMEFAKINVAEIPETVLGSAQRSSNSKGLKKIPPPTPTRPDKKPNAAPTKSSTGIATGRMASTVRALALSNERHAAYKSTSPTTGLYQYAGNSTQPGTGY